jgi:hypothetical protein
MNAKALPPPPVLGEGYGDYVIMSIGPNGAIDNWRVDLEPFEEDA